MIDPETDMLYPKRSGTKTFGEDDSVVYRWAVFDRKEVVDAYGADTLDLHPSVLADTLTGWHYQDNGAGQFFANVPHARLTRTRILVIQRCGYDV